MSVLDVAESLSENIVVGVSGASTYPLVTSSVEPLMMGFAPLPYAPNVIGDPLLPLDGAVSEVPYHTSPRLNEIESPATKVNPFTLPIVCQGCAVWSPVLASLPAAATKYVVARAGVAAKKKQAKTKIVVGRPIFRSHPARPAPTPPT